MNLIFSPLPFKTRKLKLVAEGVQCSLRRLLAHDNHHKNKITITFTGTSWKMRGRPNYEVWLHEPRQGKFVTATVYGKDEHYGSSWHGFTVKIYSQITSKELYAELLHEIEGKKSI